MRSEKESTSIKIDLDDEEVERLNYIKDYYGIKNNSEIVRFLITKEYRELKSRNMKIG